ncbi:MAG: hypothetical protein GY927_04110 [bacterium]|nr:hypothetical protein [bacterium]
MPLLLAVADAVGGQNRHEKGLIIFLLCLFCPPPAPLTVNAKATQSTFFLNTNILGSATFAGAKEARFSQDKNKKTKKTGADAPGLFSLFLLLV